MAKGFNDQVREGMDIFDADNEKVGTLAETAQGYLRVSSGFLGLGKEHSIPLSAIREVRGDRIHLNITRDRLDELGSDPALMEPDGEFDGTQVERTATSATTGLEPPMREERAAPEGDEGRRLELREEELTARKQSVQTGKLKLGTDIVSEERTMDVPVTREEVTIERHPVERRPSDRPVVESDEVISVPVREEQVQVEKQTVVYQEVGVGKRAVQETAHVSDTVRREEAVVQKEGSVHLDSGAAEDA